MADWDPDQYDRFKEQRAQPFWDLVELVHRGAIERAVDLGCGSGDMTVAVADRLGIHHLTGIDNSPAMLEAASQHGRVAVSFVYGDIARWTSDADHDLVLANAALHWVPDHVAVLERWVGALAPEGQLAIQVPANHDHPSYLASAHVASQEPFASAFGGEPPPDPVAANVLAPERYATVLHELGLAEPHVRLQVYPHVMQSAEAVVEWTKGTSLMRFFKRLPPEMHDPFVDAYREEVVARLGLAEPYFFTFKRILMWGRMHG
ncbi:MAG: methyltransferase domain-containing protein [Ilumatobacter sp.]|uniref:methyltransferase domain-containing protein n=1 Tax=Ilumatobacter sp. TaxID=1967498 RepID=UPI00262567A2|nr:methyltransferase domain-containing protein [Ilumatobacter sp.]MDJ0770154.1 methyltransferase domain-containing protein [Ilumatobacter sp.]